MSFRIVGHYSSTIGSGNGVHGCVVAAEIGVAVVHKDVRVVSAPVDPAQANLLPHFIYLLQYNHNQRVKLSPEYLSLHSSSTPL